jgi:hypothetical protein
MSQNLECRFNGGDRSAVRLFANLSEGWAEIDGEWAFDHNAELNYEIGAKFRCRLRMVGVAPGSSGGSFYSFDYLTRYLLGSNLVLLKGSGMRVDIPLEQVWHVAEDAHQIPAIYEFSPALFSLDTEKGKVTYQLHVWIALHGNSRKFVAMEYEWGQGFAWIAKPPEPVRKGPAIGTGGMGAMMPPKR